MEELGWLILVFSALGVLNLEHILAIREGLISKLFQIYIVQFCNFIQHNHFLEAMSVTLVKGQFLSLSLLLFSCIINRFCLFSKKFSLCESDLRFH